MPQLHHATSADGTRITYATSGSGAPVLLIGGAFTDRGSMAALAGLLAEHRTVVTYDRRGRGDSEVGPALAGDAALAAAELADAAAVLRDAASGDAAWDVFGHSSGAVLALRLATESAVAGRIAQVTAYEPTWIVPGTRPVPAGDYRDRIRAAVAAGDRDAAARAFLAESVLLPPPVIEQMAGSPVWPVTTALAHTLPSDLALHGPDWAVPEPSETRSQVAVLVGGESPEWLHATARAAAEAYGGSLATLDGQDHGILWQPTALVPHLTQA